MKPIGGGDTAPASHMARRAPGRYHGGPGRYHGGPGHHPAPNIAPMPAPATETPSRGRGRTHEGHRTMVGHRRIPCSDPKEMQLRDNWYEAKAALEAVGFPDSGPERQKFRAADKTLTDYVEKKRWEAVEEDKRKHPKAKRNLPFEGTKVGIGRTIK